jgi:hypothetical protein
MVSQACATDCRLPTAPRFTDLIALSTRGGFAYAFDFIEDDVVETNLLQPFTRAGATLMTADGYSTYAPTSFPSEIHQMSEDIIVLGSLGVACWIFVILPLLYHFCH